MFDFEKAIKDAQQDIQNKKLFLILLGSSGNGKSYAQGTFGVRTLYLYTQGESHGPKSASTQGGENIVPVCIDREGDKELTADEALKRLHAILDDVEGLKKAKFGAIAVDGASEIETLIRNSSKFRVATTTESGKHNGFAEGPATLGQFREIIGKLKKLQRTLGVHVCMTCILTVKEYDADGLILDSAPQLAGYAVATGLIQQFDDVMLLGRMQKKDKIGYRLQLLATGSKKTLDAQGEVKKTFNFSPRITGVDILSLGSTLDADLKALAELKAKGK